MSFLEINSAIEKYRERCEDRIHVIQSENRTVIVVADGAGGCGSGDLAAEHVVREISSNFETIHSAEQWKLLLQQIDIRINAGESTAVVVDVRPYGIAGASVGDSQAWVINREKLTDLTARQVRKPLLGSGKSEPVGFLGEPLDGILIVATDGFFNYAKPNKVVRLVNNFDFYEISRKCIELVRLPSGALWDDVGVVVGRKKLKSSTRKVYSV